MPSDSDHVAVCTVSVVSHAALQDMTQDQINAFMTTKPSDKLIAVIIEQIPGAGVVDAKRGEFDSRAAVLLIADITFPETERTFRYLMMSVVLHECCRDEAGLRNDPGRLK